MELVKNLNSKLVLTMMLSKIELNTTLVQSMRLFQVLELDGISAGSKEGAQESLSKIDTAITKVSGQRAELMPFKTD